MARTRTVARPNHDTGWENLDANPCFRLDPGRHRVQYGCRLVGFGPPGFRHRRRRPGTGLLRGDRQSGRPLPGIHLGGRWPRKTDPGPQDGWALVDLGREWELRTFGPRGVVPAAAHSLAPEGRGA